MSKSIATLWCCPKCGAIDTEPFGFCEGSRTKRKHERTTAVSVPVSPTADLEAVQQRLTEEREKVDVIARALEGDTAVLERERDDAREALRELFDAVGHLAEVSLSEAAFSDVQLARRRVAAANTVTRDLLTAAGMRETAVSVDDGRTITIEHCDQCPPLSEWPMKHLIIGTCPRCGLWDEDRAFREIKAREAIREREANHG